MKKLLWTHCSTVSVTRQSCHLNTQSVRNKLDELKFNLSKSKRSIVLGISESWVDSSTTNGALAIPPFTIHRRDRQNRGGGILVYVSNRFRSRRRCDIEDESIEAVWVELRIKRRVILLGNVYRPPSSDASFMTKLEVMVEKAVSECKLVVLMGDFNVNLLRTSK